MMKTNLQMFVTLPWTYCTDRCGYEIDPARKCNTTHAFQVRLTLAMPTRTCQKFSAIVTNTCLILTQITQTFA